MELVENPDWEGQIRVTEKHTKKLNPIEKVKRKGLTVEGMRFKYGKNLEVLGDLAEKDWEKLDKEQGKEVIDMTLKSCGLFHRRKATPGRFMMRLKLPNGICTSDQVDYLADVLDSCEKTETSGEICGDITTRQSWQLRGIELKNVPEIYRGLDEHGLTCFQSGLDNVRNCVGSPIAGIDPLEILDTRPYMRVLDDIITDNGRGNPKFTNLPRKFNICVVGTHDMFEHPHINDLAYEPAGNAHTGEVGFNILVGGFFSGTRVGEAVCMDTWVAPQHVVALTDAVLCTFRDFGFRGPRGKCRLMWLIEGMGLQAFRAEVEARMPVKLESKGVSLLDPTWERRSLMGVHDQTQLGKVWVGVNVPVGRVHAKDMREFARLARTYGSGELRLTVEQNVIIPNVSSNIVEELLREPFLNHGGEYGGITPFPGHVMHGLVACTGSQYCGLAVVETKANARLLAEAVEASMDLHREVRMHWTGCPNSCGQVQVADIGFMGTKSKDPRDGSPCEAVDVFLGGKIGAESHLGEKVVNKVPILGPDAWEEGHGLLPVVQELLVEHFGARIRDVKLEPTDTQSTPQSRPSKGILDEQTATNKKDYEVAVQDEQLEPIQYSLGSKDDSDGSVMFSSAQLAADFKSRRATE